jgi:hypothetical protein
MSNWILIAAGKSLMDAFNELAPDRQHASDGTVGDLAHVAEGNSDHLPDEDYPALRNKDADHIDEVHAIDVDSDLNTPGLEMEAAVQFILSRCRTGAEKRLTYVIYYDRIWEADNGWKQRAYTGASRHHEHAHFSFSYVTSLEASTVSWHLEDIPVALTDADIAKIRDAVLNDKVVPNPDGSATKVSLVGIVKPGYVEAKDAHAGTGRIEAKIDDLETTLAEVKTLVTPPPAKA